MGNCMHPEPNYQFEPKKVPSRSASSTFDDGRQISLISRLETVEGTLFLYRSILIRNFLHVQGELDKLVSKKKMEDAAFALKRQKLFESLLKKIEIQMEGVREAMENAELNKRKSQSLKTLSITYLLIEDIDELNQLEDNLHSSKREDDSVKEGFKTLLDKYGIKDEDIKEEVENIEPPFNGIELVESFFIPQNDIPNFKSINEMSELPDIMLLPRFSSNTEFDIQNRVSNDSLQRFDSKDDLVIQYCASNSNMPNFASNTEIQVPVVLGS